MTASCGRIVVVRHGETEWSRDGRHTGRTDIPLTAVGEERARLVRGRLAALEPALRPSLVLSSPLSRARRTAALAGLEPRVDDDLLEWDYGSFEGRTTDDIRVERGDPSWTVWTTPDGLGESAEEVAGRCARVIARCVPTIDDGDDAVLVAHAHVLRILAATWLDLAASYGASLVLATAGIGILGHERTTRALTGWNV